MGGTFGVKSNEEQLQVIRTTESPLLVIAGPGAGKTKTLVDRVCHLIYDLNVTPENILIGTFTEKAAKELLSRISTVSANYKIQKNISEIRVGTLHSLFLDFLEEYREYTDLRRGYRVLDDFEQQYLVYRNALKFNLVEGLAEILESESAYGWKSAKKICYLVNKVAEENLDLEKLAQSKESNRLLALAQLVSVYRKILFEENALDFSLIQTKMWELLDNQEVLKDIRKKIHYIMVDEYQDTNRIQEQILLKMAAPDNRICVVGDDDQALYRFRGATVENILRFRDKFPGLFRSKCKKVEMDKNYRSHPDIIDFYNKWMERPYDGEWGEFRHNKVVKCAGKQNRKNSPYTGVVKCMGQNVDEWCRNFYNFIHNLELKGSLTDYNQVALLAYSVKNEKIVALTNYLEKHDIPVFSPRSGQFFNRKEIQLAIGALLFLFPKCEETYLDDGSNAKFMEGIWAYYDLCLDVFANELRKKPQTHRELQVWAVTKAKEIAKATRNTDYSFANLFYEMLQFPLFADFLDMELDSGVKDLRPLYNLGLFSQLLARFESMNGITGIYADGKKRTQEIRRLFNEYFKFLHDGGIAEFEDFDMVTPSGCVSIMTIHQSKGLEFPVTCVDSLDSCPRKNYDELDVEIAKYYHGKDPWEPLERTKFFDFWRLYYTAFSRAQNLLVLTGIDNSAGRERGEFRSPSKYFAHVYESVPDFTRLFAAGTPDISLDLVKPSNVKHQYSFTSHVLLYENCPTQYKFFREVEFSPVRTNAILFGTLVHETIEDVHRQVLAGNVKNVTSENMREWLQDNYRQISKELGVYLRQSSLDSILNHVENYVDYASRDWAKVKEAEVPLTLLKEDYILEGRIDLIQGSGETLEILDFKTDVKPDVNNAKDREKLNRYKRQLEIYAHIVEEKYGKPVSKMHLFYTGTKDGSPYVTYDYSRSSIENTMKEVADVVHKIERKDFTRTRERDPKKCSECDFRHYCNNHC